MISRLGVGLRWLRRKASRTHWAARLLGIQPAAAAETDLPGLILLQIDGLSRTQLERAMAAGNLPFLSRLIRRRHFTLETFYAGVPSTTPAVQGELFFGVRTAVPSFQFLHRRSGRVFRMYEAEAAATIEHDLAATCAEPLLQNGHAYSDIFRAGAAYTRYCSQDLDTRLLLSRLHPLSSLLLAIAYAPRLLRIAGLAAVEFGLAIRDALLGVFARQDALKEIVFVPTRVLVCIVLREFVRLRVLLDIERGVQLVHANFLGYDEQAHRRGPDSAFAHWTLQGIDRALRDIYRAAANSSSQRDYEVMVYSDHGQEHTIPFATRHGRELAAALASALDHGPLAGRPLWTGQPPAHSSEAIERGHHRAGRRRVAVTDGPPDPASHIIVTSMGPLGHLYAPVPLAAAELDGYAVNLVAEAGIPLVLRRSNDGAVRAFNSRGSWTLPDDRGEILGPHHPFLDEAADDLVRLCYHPDAGDLVLSGWDPQQLPLTFPPENGGHGGPGSEETRGFLLLPDRIQRWHVAHLARTQTRVRAEDLRRIALHFLGRDGPREERVPHHPARGQDLPVRVMTYNIHSCHGVDGKIRPERIARVINHFDPDVVAVQEIDAHRPRTGHHDQARLLADHLRMTHVFHALFEEEKERYGIAIFARHPFTLVKSGYLTPAGPRRRQEARGAIWIQLELEGRRPFHFINTHFGLGREERRRQTQSLLGPEWLGRIPDEEPVIVCGDFNSGPSSLVHQRLQPRFRDVQEAARNHQPKATFSSVQPVVRIDHIFVSRHFGVESVELPDTPTAMIASDHLPLCAELTLTAPATPGSRTTVAAGSPESDRTSAEPA